MLWGQMAVGMMVVVVVVRNLLGLLEVNRGLADSAFLTGPWKLRSGVTTGRHQG